MRLGSLDTCDKPLFVKLLLSYIIIINLLIFNIFNDLMQPIDLILSSYKLLYSKNNKIKIHKLSLISLVLWFVLIILKLWMLLKWKSNYWSYLNLNI